MKKHIIPAIIAKTQEEMAKAIDSVKEHVDIIQLDVMDGQFVPNESLNFELDLPRFKGSYEAHLMRYDSIEFIKKYINIIDNFIVHVESLKNYAELDSTISYVRIQNKKISLAINPSTTIDEIRPYLDKVDMILVLTVDPGFYGSPFIPKVAEKIKKLRKIRLNMDIEVDGGIKADTIGLVNEAGANLFVSGSFVMNAEDKKEKIDKLKGLVENG